jgi:spore germination protein GerM
MKRWMIVLFPFIFLLPACSTAAPVTPPPSVEITSASNPTPEFISVFVYFTPGGDPEMAPVPVARAIPVSENLEGVIRATLKELLKGPTASEQAQGLTSWFSPTTAQSLISAAVWENELSADFTGFPAIIPNASTSAGSQMLLSQLNSTLFQFPSIQTIHYTMDSDCNAFWEWLQFECHPVTRADWEKG